MSQINPEAQKTEGESSRRQFLKGSTVAAAGAAAAASSLPVESFAQVAGSDEIKVGIVGVGGRGSGAVAQTLNVDGCRLVAAGDVFESRLHGTMKERAAGGLNRIQDALKKSNKADRYAVTKQTEFVGFDCFEKVIDKCDMVVLTTPPGFRPEMFEAAIRAGKHVFMEKPVCTDAKGYNRTIEAAKLADEKGLKVVVGLQRHYHDSYREAFKKVWEDGIIGNIVSAQAYWNGGRPWTVTRNQNWSELEWQMYNWYHFAWVCGDHIAEQHVHNIDVVNWFVSGDGVMGGNPVSAQGMGSRSGWESPKSGEIFDHHYVEFRYDNGVIMNSQCRQIKGTYRRVEEEIQGSEGILTLSQGKAIAKDYKGNEIWKWAPAGEQGGDRRRRGGGAANPYQVEHNELHAAIRENKPLNNAYYGAKSSFTATLGRLATYTGQVVKWDEATNSNFELVPDKMTWDHEPPVKPNSDLTYNYAIPGQTKLPWA